LLAASVALVSALGRVWVWGVLQGSAICSWEANELILLHVLHSLNPSPASSSTALERELLHNMLMLSRTIHAHTSMLARAHDRACAPATRAHPLLLARDLVHASANASCAHPLFLARGPRPRACSARAPRAGTTPTTSLCPLCLRAR
jgi:hypothetical protein